MLPAQSSDGVAAVLPLTMVFLRDIVPPRFQMPPPLSVAMLPEIVLLTRCTVPNLLNMPPPLSAVFPLTVLFVMVAV